MDLATDSPRNRQEFFGSVLDLNGMLELNLSELSATRFDELRAAAEDADHFGASALNLQKLGIRHVFVLARDPRAAAASFVNVAIQWGWLPRDEGLLSRRFIDQALLRWIPWLSKWMEAASAPASHLSIHWVRPPCSGADLRSNVQDILFFLAPEYPVLRAYLDHLDQDIKEVTANFVIGDDNRLAHPYRLRRP